MGKKTFGIKVGATKFLHAENQTEQDRLEMMHRGMRLLYIKDNATMALGTDNHRRPAGSDDEVRILRETNRAFDSYVEKKHRPLQKRNSYKFRKYTSTGRRFRRAGNLH